MKKLLLGIIIFLLVYGVILFTKALLASYSLFSVVDFGAGRSGLSTVGYKVYTQSSNTLGSRITTGVQEIGATGKYGAVVTFADGFVGGVLWDSGEATPVYAMDVQNPQTGENLDAKVTTRGTSNYAGTDTSGTTTLLARLTSTRAGLLDNLDAAVSTRLATSGYAAPPSAATITDSVWNELLSGHTTSGSAGAVLAVAGAGSGDTPGTTTLLSRLTSTRAGLLDHLNADITSRMATFTLPANFSALAITTGGRVDATDIWNVTLPASYTGQKAGNLLWRVGNKP